MKHEPKFNIGDTIRRKGYYSEFEIEGLNSNGYEIRNSSIGLLFTEDADFELVTPAKPEFQVGDVVLCSGNGCVMNDNETGWGLESPVRAQIIRLPIDGGSFKIRPFEDLISVNCKLVAGIKWYISPKYISPLPQEEKEPELEPLPEHLIKPGVKCIRYWKKDNTKAKIKFTERKSNIENMVWYVVTEDGPGRFKKGEKFTHNINNNSLFKDPSIDYSQYDEVEIAVYQKEESKCECEKEDTIFVVDANSRCVKCGKTHVNPFEENGTRLFPEEEPDPNEWRKHIEMTRPIKNPYRYSVNQFWSKPKKYTLGNNGSEIEAK